MVSKIRPGWLAVRSWIPWAAGCGFAALGVSPALAEIEEVVVTARKRAEILQEVPMSVTAIDTAQLERLGLRDLKDITRYTPGVTLDRGFGLNDQRLVIRGLSPSRGRPNSAALVDGIDLTTESVSTPGGSLLINPRLLDIEQVEVVKGPQSALYGRAAFAGAISYTTRGPGDELEAEAGVDVGEYGRRYLRAAIGGPVTEAFGLRLNALKWNEDGYYQEGFTGADLGGGHGHGVSLVAQWDNDGRLTARGRVAYSDDEYDQQATFYDAANTFLCIPLTGPCTNPADTANEPFVGLFGGSPPDAAGRVSFLTPRPEAGDIPAERKPYEGGFAEVLNTSLKLDWELNRGTITSYTGYSRADTGQEFDADFDVRPNADFTEDIGRGGSFVDFDTETRVFSQELRYSSNVDGPVQYAVGALYWDEKVDQVETGVSVLALPPWPGSTPEGYFNSVVPTTIVLPNNVGRDTNSRSLYGTLDWDIAEQWRLGVEARYAREQMDVLGSGCGNAFICAFPTTPDLAIVPTPDGLSQIVKIPVTDSKSGYYFTPKAVIEWTPLEDLLTYFSISRGVKPGGIATVASGSWMDQGVMPDGNLNELKFDEEKLTAFELGGKTTLFDRSLQLNGAVFFQKYDDKQVPVQQLVNGFLASNLENAGNAEVKGLELEAIWVPTDNTRLQLGYSYLDGKYNTLSYTTNSNNSVARAGNCLPVAGVCQIELNGNSLEDIPKHSVVLVGGWYPPFGDDGMTGLLEIDAQFEDERFIDEFNDRMLKSYTVFNVRAGVQSDRWDAILYINNALDDDTIKSWSAGTGVLATAERFSPNLGIFPPEGFSIAPPPRHWGIRGTYRF
ncbi:MAG: TonB-dependent receptor [Gammaproteobacteria bacterium]|nr:TonB-dependent receptor [Gammaproteobacteria bacterium]